MRNHVIVIDITCKLSQKYFKAWKYLTAKQRAAFENHPTRCDGGGVIGTWCKGCKFCYAYEEL